MVLVADRFELEQRAAAGAMGVVYRARDRLTGERVALKLMAPAGDDAARRFALEARIVAELRHPGIVRHIADGITVDGAPWLAMEWLDGETLAARLQRGPLSVDEATACLAAVAEALAAAHDRGVVHRDVKPSNVFLVGGATATPRLLDFGVVRVVGDARGEIVGTPAYMSPEQARGTARIDARSDLFSLGCVAWECLAGHPPFAGEDPRVVLAKILFSDAPRLREARPDVPGAVDELVAELLQRDRALRPSDGRAVAAALRAAGAGSAPAVAPPAAVGAGENRLVSVVLARGVAPAAELAGLAREHDARLETLVDGTLVALLVARGAAADLGARAKRCAAALHALAPGSQVAVATGRGVPGGALPVGESIERAAALLADAAPGVRACPVTAALLDTGQGGDDERRLLGRRTPCVGRERELAQLDAVLDACVAGAGAHAVLVTGPPGVGKSRLVHEPIGGWRRGGRAAVWSARGDPMRAGSPFALAGQALRSFAQIGPADDPDGARRKLLTRVADEHDAAFLGELCGLPFPDEDRVQLRAARANPMLMGDRMRRAWEDLLAAECARAPLVLVLEDLHWGDLPTVTFVDSALRNLGDRPFLVVAVARPEVEELFPALWAGRRVTRLVLDRLADEACERLVAAVLDGAPAAAVARVVALAAGNAFYLEELIRAVAAGAADALPATVLAMAQSRLEALPEAARRVLRAGSIFGERFAARDLAALVGEGLDVEALLADLAAGELLVRGPETLSFRHGLLREAAYAMLTDHDRAVGHRRAAAWLEQAGESDALVLAAHLERGGEPARAARSYRRAAEQALEANDLDAVLARCARAAACGAEGSLLAETRLLEATARHWRTEYQECARAAGEAMRDLPPLSAPWYRAAEELAEASLPLGKIEDLVSLGRALHPPRSTTAAGGAFVSAAAGAAMQLFIAGRKDDARGVMSRLEATLARLRQPAPLAAARAAFARATEAMMDGDLGQALEHARSTVAAFDAAGDRRGAALMRGNLTHVYVQLGAYHDAAAESRRALADAERLGLAKAAAFARLNLASALTELGVLDEARALILEALRLYADNQRSEGAVLVHLAAIDALAGDLAAARTALARALARLQEHPPMRAYALATLSHVLLLQDAPAEALAAARDGMATLEKLGGLDLGEALLRLSHARALHACGERTEARDAIRAARDWLQARAERISDATWRRSYLERVKDNAEILATYWGTR